MYAIHTTQLGRRFGDLEAVAGLDLTIAPGEIFGLVGPDGAGKTTTMRMLTGILRPTSGEAWVEGHHVVQQAEPLKVHIGYMSQRFGLYPDLTVQENIDFYADLYDVPKAERPERMERLLAFSNLTPFRRRRAGNLSGGMKQKLGLACALIHTPKVLFLDEPTNGVDPVSRRDFWRILYQLQKEGVTLFISTAYLDEAERCGRIGLLREGKLFACGTVDEVKKLMQGVLLSVACAEPRQQLSKLRDAKIGNVTIFGDRLHVVVADEAEGRSAIARALAGQTVDIQVQEPSLEDVFLSALPGGGA